MNKRIILNIAGMVFLIASFIILIDRYYSIVPEVSIPTTQKLQVLALSLDPSDPLLYNKIHQSYPKSSGGRDTVYTSLYNRKIEVADEIVNDVYAIPRFEKIEIKNISWEEDPYNDVYWRFLFYGFDPEAHLIYAGDEVKTKKGKDKYYGKLLEITNSFVDEGIYKANSWQDPHAVAFRAMILTKAWWKLREENRLSEEESAKILKAIKVHGDFLADEKNYDKGNQNSINEDSALLLLSVNFPDMPRASEWQEIAKKRVGEGLNTLINPEGILIGNSPFYHYYALEKYWSLYKYANNYNINISNDFEGKLLQMVSYGTYILQPNTEIPLIGASIKRKINFAGPYDKLSQLDPAFLYVLTQGKDGKVPTKLNVHYKNTGQAILRSGWGKGNDFGSQAQIVFDTGGSQQNQLDALSFNLYGKGMTLMPDSGLYSYEENELTEYFKGTYAHNTVVVDGKGQNINGQAIAGDLFEGDGYSYQAAQHSFYPGVEYKRAIMLIDKNLALIIDELNSDAEHDYEQVFHLAPKAKIKIENLTVAAAWNGDEHNVKVSQLLPNGVSLNKAKGETSPPRGLCSENYNTLMPCDMISYSKKSKDALFVTLIEIGKSREGDVTAAISEDGKIVNITNKKKEYSISIEKSPILGGNIQAKNNALPPTEKNKITILQDGVPKEFEGASLKSLIDGNTAILEYGAPMDLSDKNLLLSFRASGIENVTSLSISLSNNDWQSSMVYNLMGSYKKEDDEEIIVTSIGKGKERISGGQWKEEGVGFDWAKIDKIMFKISSKNGSESILDVKDVSIAPGQEEGAVIIVFDDGTRSLLLAADVMKEQGLKGNIAAIGNYIQNFKKGYLTLNELKDLQDNHGWNIASHSFWHKDALVTYHSGPGLKEFEQDIIQNMAYLNENKINSAPNWYIYPLGSSSKDTDRIIGKYYKFARVTQNSPESYPFGNPLRVKTLSVNLRTTPEQVSKAVSDAKNYNLALFLTFHKICGGTEKCDLNTEYDIDNFKRIIEDIKKKGIKVKTLSEFDFDNNVSTNEVEITKDIPEQIILRVNITDNRNSIIKLIDEARVL